MTVYIGIPTTRDIPPPTVNSLAQTIRALQGACEFKICTGTLVHYARTLLARRFLETNCSHLFFIDSDIEWVPADFIRILRHAHAGSNKCVVGIYPDRKDPLSYHIVFENGAEPDENGLTKILGCGLGFACIHREVIEKLAFRAPQRIVCDEMGPSIFRFDHDGDEERTEDFAFWSDVKALGYDIKADATVCLGHVGTKTYRGNYN